MAKTYTAGDAIHTLRIGLESTRGATKESWEAILALEQHLARLNSRIAILETQVKASYKEGFEAARKGRPIIE